MSIESFIYGISSLLRITILLYPVTQDDGRHGDHNGDK